MRSDCVADSRLMQVVCGVAGALAVAGCMQPQTARLYRVADGRSSSVAVSQPGDRGGSLRGTLPSGEACQGTFGEMTSANTAALAGGSYESGAALRSLAVMVCDRSVLRCTLVRKLGKTFTFGACKDDHGVEYNLFF